jgi:FkbM family methyltransferase
MRKFLKLKNHFGFIGGLIILLKLKLGFVKNIKLPGIEHPIFLRKGTSDIPTFYQVFADDEYDIPYSQPKIMIDGGANIGLFAVLMKNKFPESQIISIEPDKSNFEVLTKNTHYYKNVWLENSGIWSVDAKLKVFDKYDAGKWGMVVEENEKEGNIPAISINSLIKKYAIQRIDLLKLDIETSEKNLFSSAYQDWLPLVKTIIIELHDRMEPGCSKPFFEAINKTFKRYNLSIEGENVIIDNLDLS